MPDLDKVKRNVTKMVSMNAPESYIDQYIDSEGATIDQVKNHAIGKPQQNIISGIAQGIGNEFQQSANKMQRGSVVAGAAQAGNAGLQTALSPISYADQKIRSFFPPPSIADPNRGFMQVAGNVVNAGLDAAGLVARGLGAAGEGLTKAGLGYGGAILGHNLGTSPQNASDIYRELPKLGNTVGMVALPEPIAKGVSKGVTEFSPLVKQGIENRNTNMAGQEFRQLAPPSKSASKALQAKNYDAKIAEAVPEIRKDIQAVNGKVIDKNSDVAPVEQMTDFVRNTKNRIWNEVTQKVDPLKNDIFDTKVSADKTLNSIKQDLTQFQSKDLSQVESFLKNYEQPSTIGEVSREVSRLNSEVSSYEKLTNEKKAEARRTEPLLDVQLRLRDNLREDMFNQIEASGVQGVPELRKKYGAVAELHNNLLGNLEKNKGLDKKGNLFGVFQGTPIAYSLIMGAITKLATDNPMLLGVEAATAASGMYAKQRSKPSPTSNRIVRRLQ